MNWRHPLGYALWLGSLLPQALAFNGSSRHLRETQAALLSRILARNRDTDYGRRYGFAAIDGVEAYQARVPVSDGDSLGPDLEAIAAGRVGVLTSERVRLLEPTSGSTRPARLIPYTAGLQADFQRALAPWLVALYASRPRLAAGRAYWAVSPAVQAERHSPGGLPIGFEEDAAYLGGLFRRLVQPLLAVPACLRELNGEAFWQATCKHLMACPDLTMISVWSPTFLGLLLDQLDHPQRLWPRLRLVSSWGDGPSAAYLDELRRRLPGVEFQPKGLLATEGVVSIPLGLDGQAPVLAARSHFFEFEREGAFRLAHQLEAGQDYGVVLTTSGGLYRYRLGDRVRVEGFWHQLPRLRFLGREGLVLDRFGEKLSALPVGAALGEVLSDCPLAFLAWTGGPGYTLVVEPPDHLSDDQLLTRARRLDERLCENPHYRLCRDYGQLGRLGVFRAERPALEAFYRVAARDRRWGDLKLSPLSRLEHWVQELPGRLLAG